MRLTFHMETNKVGSRCECMVEIDDEEWDELTETERNEYALQIFLDDVMSRLGDWGWTEDGAL